MPDDYEMNRNNVVYKWQKNRNPFIDLPELVGYIFGEKSGDLYTTVQILKNESDIKFYPNPVVDEIVFNRNISGEISIVNIVGKEV